MSERVTKAVIRDVDLRSGGVLALLTLLNDDSPTHPITFGPLGLKNLEQAIDTLAQRATAGEIVAAAVTGKPFHFAAGADLHAASEIDTVEKAAEIGEGGHRVFTKLSELAVPTFAFIGGVALGGGLELALSCDYRTASSAVRAIGLPEVSLGLIPGWGGTYRLPRLIGMTSAIKVIIENPLSHNRLLNATKAKELGVVDAVIGSADFLAESVRFAERVITGATQVARRNDGEDLTVGLAQTRSKLESRYAGALPAVTAAIGLLELSASASPQASFAAETEALSKLIVSEEFHASVYSFDLTSHRAKHPAALPQDAQPKPVGTIAVIGAGLMASQLAMLFAHKAQVQVIMRDLDEERCRAGMAHIEAMATKQVEAGRLSQSEAERIQHSIRTTTDLADLAGADLAIEAVFEELGVKKQVFAELESVLEPEAVLATNTSALSVSAMAEGLAHPERVVGIHFFNPVAQMPLVEVIKTAHTDEATFATAFDIAKRTRKSAIGASDAPGFIVNRLLVRLLAEILSALEDGADPQVANEALAPMALPMSPFELLDLVGTAVANHVLVTLHTELGERYRLSPGLEAAVAAHASFMEAGRPGVINQHLGTYFPAPRNDSITNQGLREQVEAALAEEISAMLAEDVVADRKDIDLAMILGAGWGFHLGGITPYLTRVGAL